ncbi:hypothetical protein QFZ32_005175 [Streptomyces canus]|uniref:Uncharacterized protein n=1 Tax=Streptomyces canus TaxID=58343 RepID=A0AAW8FIV6_9ACTN|nr:hypothetical protein [Streptomyces canus]MDQ0909732.1 hypothetical protein [Streptomyces canus]MDQ1069735.1 hypothetical protein [Streptomyces canus]
MTSGHALSVRPAASHNNSPATNGTPADGTDRRRKSVAVCGGNRK